MTVIKKNQIIIFVIALMLIATGYLNFIDINKSNTEVQASADTFGDAMLVSSNSIVENEDISAKENLLSNKILDAVSSNTNNIIEEKQQATKVEKVADDYFANSRMERENMYSQIIESYQKMIEEDSLSAEQKAIAQNEITKINKTKNAIMITENLIKMKGFEDVVILVNDENVNIVIAKEKLTQEEVAQVENIVSREMEASIENIHINSK